MDPKTVVREFWESYGRGGLDQAWTKYMAEDLIVHAPPPMQLDRESWLATEKAFFAAFDDIGVKVIDQVAEGDKVASRWSMTARQTRLKKRYTPSTPRMLQGLVASSGPMNISYSRRLSAPYSSTTLFGLMTLPRALDIL